MRGNVAPFATVGTAEETRAGMRAAIEAGYNVADIEAVHCASGGGGRCIDSGLDDLGGSVEQGLDLYHAMKHVRKTFPEGASRAHLVSPALKRRPEAFVCAIDRMMPKAADARRRERMRECRDRVANHADLLRGGGSLDTMEAANAYVRAPLGQAHACKGWVLCHDAMRRAPLGRLARCPMSALPQLKLLTPVRGKRLE